MKESTREPVVSPGGYRFNLTKAETCRAMFISTIRRRPTEEEIGRCDINVAQHDDNGWELIFWFNDLPPTLLSNPVHHQDKRGFWYYLLLPFRRGPTDNIDPN